ncbi:Domain of unknown function DUF1814 [Ammonifex degensii KC4]|uniref:Nucleotidyl transferase AbiEii/AbiGii toxin family protein n=1 Tax=Ammonifex degensii (strain DSM 10501 / KC4) TaxID=429009 RepID=C9RB09_AMMDK|nr:nucleotidyl transferase AbiEii/AbiGii toxin family protein [Ammonifex degensii]ACX51436.1 Domain of unknown function DUF1814 [Ammonifex degensii KC4]
MTWKVLFDRALEVIDAAAIPAGEWTFGGGSALAFRFNHRVSRDVDIFLTDAQLLLLATPRLNTGIAERVSDYEEAASSLKLFFPEGQVDFIVAPHLTKDYFTEEVVCGRRVRVETPVEIVIKKLFYRAEFLKVRDIVDVATVFKHQPEVLLGVASGLLGSRLRSIEWKWSRLEPKYRTEVEELEVQDADLKENTPVLFATFLERLAARIRSSPPPQHRSYSQ